MVPERLKVNSACCCIHRRDCLRLADSVTRPNQRSNAPFEQILMAEFAIIAKAQRSRTMDAAQCELTFSVRAIRLELHWDICASISRWIPRREILVAAVNAPSRDSLLPNFHSGPTVQPHRAWTRHAWSRMMWLVECRGLLRQSLASTGNCFFSRCWNLGASRMAHIADAGQ